MDKIKLRALTDHTSGIIYNHLGDEYTLSIRYELEQLVWEIDYQGSKDTLALRIAISESILNTI
jgi:hypothetical protein